MVVDSDIDRIFHALADATRRDIVTRVLQRPHSVSELAAGYAMSFAAVQKHVAVLERAALVSKSRNGREQLVSGEVDTIGRARELLGRYERLWHARANAIDALLAAENDTNNEN
ncbi:ArsR/SmtB family transcription factor [Gryllotalpicola protaetiae]|uniref:ArsR family transcriptional regulator n=1 Tax=Gryllotalpicola protaetiae TaxID=2419771 RepID=A0A387BQB8_9MICO|nr:helix-turn-helix domain-containing protein [Gryllotalpicola protaetiae]AYG04712.1 ArsR family transcriptional regulator [Gryllotalpicola protaetiae]